MINEKYTDGKEKPQGLCEWQQKYNVHDEDPFFGLASQLFVLLSKLPGYITEMAQEREKATREHYRHMVELKKAHDGFEDAERNLKDLLRRTEPLLFHLSAIETKLPDIAKQVVGDIDYLKIIQPLNEAIVNICAHLPLDRVDCQVEHLANSVNKMELCATRMDDASHSIEKYKTSKNVFVLGLTGGICGTIILLILQLFCSKSPYVGAVPSQSTNTVSEIIVEPVKSKPDPYSSLRNAHLVPFGQTIESKGSLFIELIEEK